MTRDAQAEGERVLDHHRAQLVLCDLPEPRVKCVVVRCGERESTGDGAGLSPSLPRRPSAARASPSPSPSPNASPRPLPLPTIPPTSALRKTIKDQNVDHVVLGTRGLGAIQRALLTAAGLGSVSNELAHHATVPVTVVPASTPVPEMIRVREARGEGPSERGKGHDKRAKSRRDTRTLGDGQLNDPTLYFH